MKTFFYKIILLITIIIGLSVLLSSVFLKKDLLRTYNMYLLEEEVDIVFVGSSHVFASLDTDFLDEQINANTFLLATPSQNISQSYYLIKEFIGLKKSKVIFLETYSFKDYSGTDFVNHAAYDGMKLSSNKIKAAKDAALSDTLINFSRFSNLLFPLFKYHNRWNGDITEKDFTYYDNVELNKGSEIPKNSNGFIRTKLDYIDYSLPKIKEQKPLPENINDKLTDIINLCENNQIKLVLFSTPYLAHHGFSVDNQVKTMNYIKENYTSPNLNYLDFNLIYKDIDISYEDFKDSHHLNYKGAIKINTYLAHWTTSNYKKDLPNRITNRVWYKYFNNEINDNILFQKEVHFYTNDNIIIENIVFIEDNEDNYIIIDVNDNIDEAAFLNNVMSDDLRMMIHLYPNKEDLDKIISDNNFENQDFKPAIITLNGNKFIYSKLKKLTTSEISFYKYANFTFYSSSKGRGKVLTIHNIEFNKN